MFAMLSRLMVLPFHFIFLFWALFTPFAIVTALRDGGAKNYVFALVLATSYPMALTLLHASRIEHFIARRLRSPKQGGEYANRGYLWKSGFLGADQYLLRLLADEREVAIDRATHEKGLALARRHRWLALMTLWGLGLMVAVIVVAEYTVFHKSG